MPNWRKSSYSSSNPQCVEVAMTETTTLVRDSKNPEGGTLSFNPQGFAAFLRPITKGQVDTA